MIFTLRSELLKLRSTRTTVAFLAATILLTLLIGLLDGLLTHPGALSTTTNQLNLLASGGFALIFSSLAGVLLLTSEYRHGTIRPTFLFTPRRERVLGAKLAAGALGGIAFGLLAMTVAIALGLAILSARGIPLALAGAHIRLLALGGLAAIALRGAFGVGLGAILKNQVAAVIALLAWDFVITGLLFGLAPSIGRFMPTEAANALMGLKTAHLLPPAAGAGVLIAWTVTLALAGLAITRRAAL
jgi:ABC-2 type transport system permease protein